MNFTKEQEEAIFTRGEDILVSAGAGAGKTRVLVTRISEMILNSKEPVSADEMLVLTFTNAAAREMKERIVKELEDRLQKEPDNRRLRQQIRVVKHADISTVHSFCNHLIRTHFNELAIDPSFRIAEEGELKILRQEAMELLLEEKYEKGKEAFLNFVEAYGGDKNDRNIEAMIENLFTFSRKFPDPQGWLAGIDHIYDDMRSQEGMKRSYFIKILMNKIHSENEKMRAIVKEARDLFGDSQEPKRFYDFIQGDQAIVDAIDQATSYDSLYDYMAGISFTRKVNGNSKEKEWPHLVKVINLHEDFKKLVKDLQGKCFVKTLDQMVMEQERIYPFFQEFVDLGQRFFDIYSQKKREKNIFDFDDLEHYALKLLIESYDEQGNAIPSTYAKEIANNYKAIFVDEYQDTNLVQEMIISTLLQCGQAELFVVGDVKQSIYRFRQARPDLFLDRYRRYEKGQGLKIELRDNFRSSPDVLAFCNRFFSHWMSREFGGIDYDKDTALLAGEMSPMREVKEEQEALFLVKDEEADSVKDELSDTLAEAVMIADRIESLLAEGYDFSDMVILLRSMKSSGQIIADYLEERRIEALCESQTGYFQTREIRVMLNYLSLVDNLYQDIPMASVLLSGIGGMTASELGEILLHMDASVRKDISLFDILQSYLTEGKNQGIQEKISRFFKQLYEFREKKQETLLHELIWEIYEKTGFYEEVLSMPNGDRRRDNLLMLMKKAEEYERTMFKGLFYFIRYMEQLRSYEIELGGGSVADNVENAVKIMTIHKSKGLEFPVVFVSRLGKRFNDQDSKERVLYHPELGIGMDVIDLERRSKDSSLMKTTILSQIKKENLEEELRILYVAMTRAQRKLLLTGMMSQKKYEDILEGNMGKRSAENASSYLDWVAPLLYENDSWIHTRLYHFHEILDSMEKGKKEERRVSLGEMMDKDAFRQANVDVVEKAFSRIYPHEESISWKSKNSVSELKKIAMQRLPEEEAPYWEQEDDPDQEVPKPAFLKEETEELSGTAYGSMIHKLMELLPFARIHHKKDLYEELNKLYPLFPQITEVQKKKAYRGAEAFLFSQYGDIIRQMDRQGRLYKEYPFTFGVDSSVVYPNSQEKEMIIVQGIIDLYGQNDKGLWLIDYKTDRIKEGEESKLLDRYKEQMLYYRLALEQMLKMEVKESLIYSFALQKYISIEW